MVVEDSEFQLVEGLTCAQDVVLKELSTDAYDRSGFIFKNIQALMSSNLRYHETHFQCMRSVMDEMSSVLSPCTDGDL